MGVDDGDAADGAATTTHVLDIQSDWQTTADDSFWVSSSDRVVLLNPDPIAGADVVLYSASPTVIHSVHKTNRGIASSPYHITGQSRYGLTIASELYSTTFYTPHAQTSMQTQLYAVSTSPNGAFVGVGGADGLFHLTQIPTHTSLHLAGHVADVTHVAFFPSSLVALTGSTDFSLRIWSLQSFKCGAVLRGHRGAICGIGILGRGRNVVSCAHDRLVKLWHCGTSYSFRDWALSSTPRCLNVTSALPREPHDLVEPLGIEPNNMEFETSSTWLVVGTDAGCTVLDARAPTPVTLLPHSAAVTSCATKSLDSATLLITGTEHGVVSSYDMRYEKRPLCMVSRSGADVRSIQWADKSMDVWVATADGSCTRWSGLVSDGRSPQVTGELVGPTYDAVNGVSVSVGGTLSTVSRDGILRSYDIAAATRSQPNAA